MKKWRLETTIKTGCIPKIHKSRNKINLYKMKNNTIELNKNEEILITGNAVLVNGYIPDNPFFDGRETGVDGRYCITNQRIYFRSKKNLITRDLFKEEFSISLKDIVKVEEKNLFIFLPFFLELKLNDDSKVKLSFGFGRKKPLDVLQTLKLI